MGDETRSSVPKDAKGVRSLTKSVSGSYMRLRVNFNLTNPASS